MSVLQLYRMNTLQLTDGHLDANGEQLGRSGELRVWAGDEEMGAAAGGSVSGPEQ